MAQSIETPRGYRGTSWKDVILGAKGGIERFKSASTSPGEWVAEFPLSVAALILASVTTVILSVELKFLA